MGKMHVLGRTGDSEMRWDPRDPDSVREARGIFDDYLRDRFLAFSVPLHSGEDATRITQFDPEATEIIVTRPLVGG
jgi:hypothetical protein